MHPSVTLVHCVSSIGFWVQVARKAVFLPSLLPHLPNLTLWTRSSISFDYRGGPSTRAALVIARFAALTTKWLWWGKRFLSPINSISYFHTFGENLFEMADVGLQDHFSGLRVNQLDCDRWGRAVNFTRLWPQRQKFGNYLISSASRWGDVLCTSLSLWADKE